MPEQDFSQGTYRRPLADGEADGARSAHQTRARGVATVRRWSNWSLAALVVGVAGGTAALARTIPSHPASTPTAVAPGAVAAPGTGATSASAPPGASSAAPSAPKPVAVTSPSGVTTYVGPTTASGAQAGKAGGTGTAYVTRDDT